MTADVALITLEPLTLAERRALLSLARHTLRAALAGNEPAPSVILTPALSEPTAAFVSLHREGRLRGCIGTLSADKPLHDTVTQMALSAALDDPRFPPLGAAELPTVEIEISRLSRLVAVRPEQVCPGLHGVSLTCGEHRAVFLPQVATVYNWDHDMLLGELCRKAMLPPDAWRRAEATLKVFAAEVFAETPDLG